MNKITIYHQNNSVVVTSDEEVEVTIENQWGTKFTEVVKPSGITSFGANEKSLLEEMEQ
jgi:hypothetical protein